LGASLERLTFVAPDGQAEKKLEAEASKASRMIQRFEMEAEMGLR
jgi:hypothetical protein